MERNEISMHEVRFYRALQKAGTTWLSSAELAERSNIAKRTARAFALKFSQLNLTETAEVFPGHRYRLDAKANKTNNNYMDRLERAGEVFNL